MALGPALAIVIVGSDEMSKIIVGSDETDTVDELSKVIVGKIS